MSTTDVPKLMSVRSIARSLAMPGRVIEKALIDAGAPRYRLGRTTRYRESDVLGLIESMRAPTPEEAIDRADLAIRTALEEAGVARPRRGRRKTAAT